MGKNGYTCTKIGKKRLARLRSVKSALKQKKVTRQSAAKLRHINSRTKYGHSSQHSHNKRSNINNNNIENKEFKELSLNKVVFTTLAITYANPHVYLDTVVLLGSISVNFDNKFIRLAPKLILGAQKTAICFEASCISFNVFLLNAVLPDIKAILFFIRRAFSGYPRIF